MLHHSFIRYIISLTHTRTHTHTPIYIYILSSTNRLFRCITTLQYGYTCKMLQAGIETRLIYINVFNVTRAHIFNIIYYMHNLECNNNFQKTFVRFIKYLCLNRFAHLILDDCPFCKKTKAIFSLDLLYFSKQMFLTKVLHQSQSALESLMLTAQCLNQWSRLTESSTSVRAHTHTYKIYTEPSQCSKPLGPISYY